MQRHQMRKGPFGGVEDFHWEENVGKKGIFQIDAAWPARKSRSGAEEIERCRATIVSAAESARPGPASLPGPQAESSA